MADEVVEVVASWGDSILDATVVRSHERYTIGTAPGVRLVVPGLACFALVDRDGYVRRPPACDVVECGNEMVVHVGGIVIRVARQSHPAALPRPRIERRTPGFVVVSTAAHLGVWLVATLHAPIELVRVKRAEPRLVRIPPRPAPAPIAAPEPPAELVSKRAIEPPATPPRRALRPRRASDKATDKPIDAARLAATFTVDATLREQFDRATSVVKGVVDADDVSDRGFGDTADKFAPPSIASGGYVTSSLPVKQCAKDDPRCRLVGPTTVPYVRSYMLARMPELYACHVSHGGGAGTLILEFTIRGDGTVTNARGDGDAGACAARIVETIVFRGQLTASYKEDTPQVYTSEHETAVRWPITFR